MNSIIKKVSLFAAGGIVGFLIASILARREYQGVIDDLEKELNAEATKKIEEKSNEIAEKRANKIVNKATKHAVENIQKEKVIVEAKRDYKKVASIYKDKGPITNYVNKDRAEYEHPTEDDMNTYCPADSKPYIISLEQFSEEHPEFDKSTIYYYVDDDTLTDADEEIMDDIEGTVGDEALDVFTYDNEGHGDGDVVYVRNERLAIDYEIIGLFKSYKETMGIAEDK